MPIDFLAIGHITQDRVPDGFRLGGTVSYASIAALRLGRHPGMLTRASAEASGLSPVAGASDSLSAGAPLAGIQVHRLPAQVSTTFSNTYDGDGRRVQVIEAVAEPIEPVDLPSAWASVPLVLFAPIAGELPASWATQFPQALVGVTAQGWLRCWDASGHVSPSRWAGAGPFLQRANAVILSIEDVRGDTGYVAELASQTQLLVVTEGRRGATLYRQGMALPVPPRPAHEVDPTGAGDVFAAAFLIRLAETDDPLAAAHFANVAASLSVEGPGVAAIPYRAQVDREL